MKRAGSVSAHALNLHNLAAQSTHLAQPPAWRIDRFGIVGTLFPTSDAAGITQVNAWALEFGGAVTLVEPSGREQGHASVALPDWGVIITCVLLGKRAEAGR